MLRLLSRRKAPIPFAPGSASITDTDSGGASAESLASACALSACGAGSRATVLEVRCAHAEACRLRALGICEGTAVSVVDARDCTLLEVRGSRLAMSSAIAAGIMVLPIV